ncbi:MAG: hypothetical protein JSV97_10510 [candidate division WOR-3 bacterium]|nr:MAG: hypothetical protein JSV97_10510 [candidate division WOR-3 bacterium]
MNIEQKELINIIREELAEALGMDASYDRQNLTMKLRDFLDEYTGDDLQAAMDVLENVQAMLRYEMKLAAEEDEEVNEDSMADDPVPYGEEEAEQRAAEDPEQDPYITGRGADVKKEGSCGEPRKYFKLK